MRVRFNARTHVGMRREVNQDAYDARQLDQGTLLVVCDGMGGHAAGEVASRLAIETIVTRFSAAAPPDEALREAFIAANERIYEEGRGSMGTTGVAAFFLQDSLFVANVGDSRAYLVREGQIRQISHDHSFVSDQVAAGLITPEQARMSNVRNIITRALGHSAEIEVDLFTVPLMAGDTVLLSSDGMHGLITDDEIAEVAGMLPPDEAATRLVDLANERGGTDNITVVVAQVDELDTLSEPPRDAATAPPPPPTAPPAERPLSRMGLALASLALVVLLGLGGFLWASAQAEQPAAPAPTADAAATTAATAATAATASAATPSPARPALTPTPAPPPTPQPTP